MKLTCKQKNIILGILYIPLIAMLINSIKLWITELIPAIIIHTTLQELFIGLCEIIYFVFLIYWADKCNDCNNNN